MTCSDHFFEPRRFSFAGFGLGLPALLLTSCYALPSAPTANQDPGVAFEGAADEDRDDEEDETEERLPGSGTQMASVPVADSGEPDASQLLSLELPSSLGCGELVTASVLMGNNGSETWTREGGYKLGTVDDEDPLYLDGTRVWLSPDESVEPGSSHTFTFELQAPEEPGTYVSDWQMVHEAVQWFGEIASQEIEVICAEEPPTSEPPPGPPDLSTVTWLHTDVSQWPETATLSSVTVSGSNLCLDYDKAGVWPIYDFNGVDVVANPWVFIWEDEQWYGATWEWMRPGQTCKASTAVAGSHIKQDPFGEYSGWVPTSGTTYWFMVSGLARFGAWTVEERSNLVPFVWP